MKHFSHPHSLKLSESPNKEEEEDDEEIMCSGCEQLLSSPDAYTCTKPKCHFVLHKSCFELPKKTEHKSHPKHPLTLLSEPPRYSLYYDCNACDDLINGFSYNCDECDSFRLHVKCASLPESVACKAHSHALELRYYTPEAGRYSCIVSCDGSMREGYWSYFCKECDFGTHLDSAFSAEAVSEEEENEESEEEWEVENENEDEDDEEEEEDEYEVEVENEDEDDVEEENENEDDEVEEENEDEDNEEEDEYEVEVENEDVEEENENEDDEVENEDEVEEENEDDGLSEQRKLQIANLKAMDQMATINFQLQMAEMNARFIRYL